MPAQPETGSLALAIPMRDANGTAEFVRVEVWRSPRMGAPMSRFIECYAMPFGSRIAAEPLDDTLFMETIVANQRLRS